MPKCYMCPSPTVEQVREEGERDYSFRKWMSDTDQRECYDADNQDSSMFSRSTKSSLNVLRLLASKLEGVSQIINDEADVFSKVLRGIKDFQTELKDELECDYMEAMIRWPNYIRQNIKDSAQDGVDLDNRFVVLMTRRQMIQASKKLHKQIDFIKAQDDDLKVARKKLLIALDERRNLLRQFPETSKSEMCICKQPEKLSFVADQPSSTPSPVMNISRVSSEASGSDVELQRNGSSKAVLRRSSPCIDQCKMRLCVQHCYEAMREVKEAIKMALYRRRKASEIVHQTFFTYAALKKYKASPVEYGKYYGVGCNGTGGIKQCKTDIF